MTNRNASLFIVAIITLIACNLSIPAQETSLNTTETIGSNPAQAQTQVAQVATITPFPTAPAIARTTYTVERGTVAETLVFRGRWLPRDQAQLSFEVQGSVRQVTVNRGDTVQAGQLLADLQIDTLEDNLVTAQLNLERAQRNLVSGGDDEAGSLESALVQLANARLSLQGQRATMPWTSVRDAEDNVTQAERALENAERDYRDLISRPDASASAVNNAYEAVISAQERLDQARRSYQSAAASYYNSSLNLQQAENNLRLQEQEVADLQSGAASGANPDLIQAVQEAQLQIDQIQRDISQSSLYAPFDGVVLEITIRPGDSVQAFNSVITLAIPEPKEAIANLPFNDIQQLQIGQIGVCQVANQPDTAVQCIVRQLPLSSRDVDQTVRVAASLDNVPDGALIEVNMPLEVRDDTLWLPPAAVNQFQNRFFVILQTPDGEVVRDVQIGLQTDDRWEILSGVQAGDVVIQQ